MVGGASLAQTLFDGGERRAVTDSRGPFIKVQLQTIGDSFERISGSGDNLATLRILSQELRAQDAAVISSQHYPESGPGPLYIRPG